MRVQWLGLAGGVLVLLLLGFGVISTTVVLVAVLVVVVPGVAFAQLQLLREIRLERVEVYKSSMLSIAILGALTFTDGFFNLGVVEMGLGDIRPLFHLSWGVALCVAGVGVIWIFNVVAERAFAIRDPEFVRHLFPRTGHEKVLFLILSMFAGVGEEIAYRGFLLTAIALWSGSILLALVVSSVAFALVHAYQGGPGMLRAGLLGLILGASLLVTGSLVPAIVAHTLIDWVLGLWLGPRLVGPGRDTVNPEPVPS